MKCSVRYRCAFIFPSTVLIKRYNNNTCLWLPRFAQVISPYVKVFCLLPVSILTPNLECLKLYRLALKVFIHLAAEEKEDWCFKWCK